VAKRWLQQKFFEFIAEVERQREAVRAGRWAYAADSPTDPKALAGEGPTHEARESGVSGAGFYEDAKYAMVALADQIFTVDMPDWPGQAAWRDRPLEIEFFDTATAGQTVYERLDALIARRTSSERDLGEVYFHVLSLGFRGKYFDPQKSANPRPHPKIEEYRRLLYDSFVREREDGESPIAVSPEAELARPGPGDAMLPTLTQSLAFLIAAVLMVVLTNWALAYFLESRLTNAAGDILEAISGGGPP
jgi:type IV/VI secretion system ImpK/VasF family protein